MADATCFLCLRHHRIIRSLCQSPEERQHYQSGAHDRVDLNGIDLPPHVFLSQINALAEVFGVMFIVQGLIFGYFGVINDKIQYRADTTISSAMDITLTRVFRRGMVVEEKEKIVMNPAAN